MYGSSTSCSLSGTCINGATMASVTAQGILHHRASRRISANTRTGSGCGEWKGPGRRRHPSYGIGDDCVMAFTDFGIENLKRSVRSDDHASRMRGEAAMTEQNGPPSPGSHLRLLSCRCGRSSSGTLLPAVQPHSIWSTLMCRSCAPLVPKGAAMQVVGEGPLSPSADLNALSDPRRRCSPWARRPRPWPRMREGGQIPGII